MCWLGLALVQRGASAQRLGLLRPADYYRGDPATRYAERRHKLVEARRRRRERNLGLEQGTLPFEGAKVACN